ncbi:MAG: DUF2726 domain-containing protein [Desulfobacterales bacterium]|jgi:hypothetical protein|nr:DUF2726 domain-containing protein [Desulfobacterales bacterium]
MEWTTVLLIIVIVLFVVTLRLKWQSGKPDGYPYIMNQVLFSPAERSFLGALEQAIGDKYRVFGKVRVADVVSVKSMSNRSVWQRSFNRISAKHFDFVICQKSDLAVFGAIELDDKSHQKNKRQGRDAFLVGLCNAISLPLIQVPARRAYSVPEIREKILAEVNLPSTELELSAISRDIPTADPQTEAVHEIIEASATIPPAAESEGPICPKCSSPMVRRKSKNGANPGQEFWGCSDFPKCRCIIPVSAQPCPEPERNFLRPS